MTTKTVQKFHKGKWVKVDRKTRKIVAEKKTPEPYKNIPIWYGPLAK